MKYFIYALLSFFSFNSFSQIIIDRNDFGVIGDTVFLERNLTGFDSLSVGPSGTNVIKDGNSLAFIEAAANGFFGHALTLDFDSFINNLLLESTPKLNLYSFPMNYGNTNFSGHSTNSITLPVQDTITVGGLTRRIADQLGGTALQPGQRG